MKKNKILKESETDRTANDRGVASTGWLSKNIIEITEFLTIATLFSTSILLLFFVLICLLAFWKQYW